MDNYLIDDLKTRLDCREVIGRDLGAPLSTGKTWCFWCPFHNEQTPGGFQVWHDGFQCFSCGEQGDVIDWRIKHHGESFQDAVTHLNGGKVIPLSPKEQADLARKNAERTARELERKIGEAQRALEELRRAESWLQYHETIDRQLWYDRGLPDFWQDWWQLGTCADYALYRKEGGAWVDYWHTSTLSIPVWGYGWQVNNVKHRLLDPPPNGGKYRQEKTGIPPAPFIANPDMKTGPLLLVEGEIKCMVSYITADNPDMQGAGIPSKKPPADLFSAFDDYEPVYLCLDPDAFNKESGKSAVRYAIEQLGRERTRVIWLPLKIDDAINAGYIDRAGLRRLMMSARKP